MSSFSWSNRYIFLHLNTELYNIKALILSTGGKHYSWAHLSSDDTKRACSSLLLVNPDEPPTYTCSLIFDLYLGKGSNVCVRRGGPEFGGRKVWIELESGKKLIISCARWWHLLVTAFGEIFLVCPQELAVEPTVWWGCQRDSKTSHSKCLLIESYWISGCKVSSAVAAAFVSQFYWERIYIPYNLPI